MFSALFSPIKVGGHLFKNRLVGLPIYTGYAHPGGWVSQLLIEHYTQLSRSGVGMVVVANAAVSQNGIVSDFNLRIDKDDYIPGLSKLAEAIKSNGAIACLQLNHAGRFAKSKKPLLPCAMDPSNLSFNMASLKDFMNFFPLERRFELTRRFLKLAGTWTRAMTAEERDRTLTEFGSAASRACEAGFDMVEIHGAAGYLLCQFLSSFTNKIRPEHRMELTQRAAFPLAVLREIKRRVPDKFPIGYRLITREWVPEGIDLPEAISFARLLESEDIAYISASAATYNSMFSPRVREQTAKPGYLRKDVAELTKQLDTPTIISGRILRPDLADQLIKDGITRLIGLGRPLRVDPAWVFKAAVPKQRIITCINCNWCLKRVVLDKGFNCRRWSKHLQEKAELDIRLLSRNHKGLFVAINSKDLKMLQAVLRNILPAIQLDKIKDEKAVLATFLILKSHREEDEFDHNIMDFFEETTRIICHNGAVGAFVQKIVRNAKTSYDQEVHLQVESENNGLIFIPRHMDESWRIKVAWRERGRIIGYIGIKARCSDILVPVDLSISTLLTLMFLKQTFLGCVGRHLHFVHVLRSPASAIEQRWLQIKKIVDIDESIPLRMIDTKGDVADALLELIKRERFDTIVMGRRGAARIKRWLPGSVSAKLLRNTTDETLFLVD
ncbi:MAG: universal stress protein [Desulfobacterales bacterium]